MDNLRPKTEVIHRLVLSQPSFYRKDLRFTRSHAEPGNELAWSGLRQSLAKNHCCNAPTHGLKYGCRSMLCSRSHSGKQANKDRLRFFSAVAVMDHEWPREKVNHNDTTTQRHNDTTWFLRCARRVVVVHFLRQMK